jgi:Protein of unknown function (DUF2380)
MKFDLLRGAVAALAALALCCLTAMAAEPLPTIAVIGFELVDDQPDPVRDAAHQRRLAALQAQLQQGLHQRGLYRVVDTAPAQAQIEALRAQHAFLYRCNGCLAEVGQKLGTRLVVVGWVQRVSELILNVNISVRVAATDEEVLAKSVDLRGNNDESWTRAMAFMLRDWSERRERNPRYGQ